MSYLDAKTPLERIAEALEKLAGIDPEGGDSGEEMINVYFANSGLSTLYEDYTTQMAKDGEIVLPNYLGSRASGWDLFPYNAELGNSHYTADQTFTIPDEGVICTEKPSAWSLDLTTPFIIFIENTDSLG